MEVAIHFTKYNFELTSHAISVAPTGRSKQRKVTKRVTSTNKNTIILFPTKCSYPSQIYRKCRPSKIRDRSPHSTENTKAAPTRSSNLRKQSVCANCLRVYGVVCVLAQAACVKSKQFDIFCTSSQCLRRLSACLHKQTSVLFGVDTVWLCQLSLFVVRLTTLCLPKGLSKNDSL